MKLATLKDGSPDGVLHVVSRDLSVCVAATEVTPTLQSAIECWDQVAPRLERIYAALNEGIVSDAMALDISSVAAPLPRAWQWLDASAFHSHGDLLEKCSASIPHRKSIPFRSCIKAPAMNCLVQATTSHCPSKRNAWISKLNWR